ncbi:methyltransferase [Candidatus Kaiserbacteria bacterium RIFCSPHIGHO2_01_FULL_50_13]|uniref:Methyltransferase n=1 Tax=Candidatus Kaiserbacteria bacterium RIFCSPLOWO2_01_FULL_50_24 TaxID=1798507 RepID=A0A1F6EIV6_9BACT|nr:MAG: methyltransferase [Candidatus Kaiserbacteria bacterium RIFCSPHIGHO2_01_FULL_50_13]OGG73586.1 MAG: methyltransferase [Candidatus Kaiserbacteria bacterium RIFCSPLOWO2_01_FULL_50_24]
MRNLSQCRICDANSLEVAIDLGNQPWANNFLTKEEIGTEPYYPLRVVFCRKCTAAQLDYTVPKEVMFKDHTYLSGTTQTLDEHFRAVAQEVDGQFFKNESEKAVLDIGSNDGTQLLHYRALGYDVLGVESASRVAGIAIEKNGVPTIDDFFNLALVEKHALRKKFDVVNAAGIFFHLEELHSVTDAVREALSEKGVFVIQFIYMGSIIAHRAFDQIYHEHLLYYTLRSLETLLKRHGLSLFDAHITPIHGGSMIAYASRAGTRKATAQLEDLRSEEERRGLHQLSTYTRFAVDVQALKEENVAYIKSQKESGKRIYGMGAPVKGNTLLNYFGIGTDYIDCLVERNPLRKNLYSPGMHIPVVLEEDVKVQPEVYYVLAWNFKKEILARYKDLADRGVEFYFPIDPTV